MLSMNESTESQQKNVHLATNGKTCHQCRQKTRDLTASCKAQKKNKPCTIMFCHKCLLNRYGEKAEEVKSLEEWSCPKCRGICNCSVCMKRRGLQPTGILSNTAKRIGYSSVSEMLIKGGERPNHETVATNVVTSPEKENLVSPKKIGTNLPNAADEKPEKLKKTSEKRKVDSEEKNDTVGVAEEPGVCGDKSKSKKIKLDGSNEMNIGNHNNMVSSDQMANEESSLNVRVDSEKKVNRRIEVTEEDHLTFKNNKRKKEEADTSNVNYVLKQQNSDSFEEISLPVGSELTSVAGIDLCSEDVGNALQLSEFCAVFGKVLEIKKEQAEYVLHDIFHGQSLRTGIFSATAQFHFHLLTILKNGEDYPEMTSSGIDSWFNVLKESLSESQSVLKAQGLDFLDNVADYETLDATQKLRLLNILCDKVLETEKVRSWIKDENRKHAESVKEMKKEMKKKLVAARNEEKSLKQKMKDDIAAAIIAKNGAALSIAEHDDIVSRIKSETEIAHAKVLELKKFIESKGIFAKNNQEPDVVRVEPVLMCRGYSYWKLNLSDKTNVLCQNVREGDDTLSLNEEWTTIDDEGKNAIEKHVCSLRGENVQVI